MTPKDLPDPGRAEHCDRKRARHLLLSGILGDQVADAAVALDLLAVDRQQVAELSPGHSLQSHFRSLQDDLHGNLVQSTLEFILQDRPEAFDQRFLGLPPLLLDEAHRILYGSNGKLLRRLGQGGCDSFDREDEFGLGGGRAPFSVTLQVQVPHGSQPGLDPRLDIGLVRR